MDGFNKPVYQFALREDLKDDKQFLPTRAEPKASGWDVRAAFPDKKPITIKPFEVVKIPLGVRGFCPEGWWYELKPRSSSFTKKNLHALYGTVDQTYEGELVFAGQYIPVMQYYINLWMPSTISKMLETYLRGTLTIEYGEAIGQIIPIHREDMMVLECTNEDYDNACKARNAQRGTGGFGSTGK